MNQLQQPPDRIHVMLDLETMGRGPDAAIVAIGAVVFGIPPDGRGYIGPTFYRVVDLDSAVFHGGVMDASTVLWWLDQSEEARAALRDDGAEHIDVALRALLAWTLSLGASPCVWGNGAAFDNVILRRAYERLDIPTPWVHWDDRCFRTVRAENRHVPAPPREGVHHNALDDAMHQARHLLAIWERQRSVAALGAVRAEEFEPQETHS